MDLQADVSMSSEDDYAQYFELNPLHFPWQESRLQQIKDRRGRMSDMLIFDILLTSGGIRQPHLLYPPADPTGLQRLLDAISNSTFDTLKQDCLVYFLLKWHQDGREEEFKEKRCIPPQFATLSDAYWYLDSGINTQRAVSMLSDARLNRDYTSKVLQALSLSEDPHTLIRTFVRTAKPLITEPDDIDAYTIALAQSSLMEAWTYQRTYAESSDTRKRLIRKVLDWSLTPKPRLTALTHLLAFPWTSYEQSLIHAFALEPPPSLPLSSVPVIQDLVCVRLVQSGQHAAAIKLDRQFASSPRAGERAQDRRQMMDELMSAMPTAERLLLELELERYAQGRGLGDPKDKRKSSDMSMSMSWEKISPPRTNGFIPTTIIPPTPSISQRSGAPRFGGPAPVSSGSTNGEMFPSISRPTPSTGPQMPQPASTGPFLFADIPGQATTVSSTSAANGWKPKSTPSGTITQSIFASSNRSSLFDIAGSANAAPNAFFQPPASASGKRPSFFGSPATTTGPGTGSAPVSAFASLASKPVSSTSARSGRKSGGGVGDTSLSFLRGPHDVDISMLSELSESDSARGGGDDSMAAVTRALDNSADMDESAEFSISVFGRSAGPSHRKIATDRGARVARTETEAMLPPGAFLPDGGEEGRRKDTEVEPETEGESVSANSARRRKNKRARTSGVASAGKTVRRASSPPRQPELKPVPEPEPEGVRTRTSARGRRTTVKAKDLARSIPGSLMDDDDDEEEEEGDETDDPERAARVSAATGDEEDEDRIAPLPTPARRSARATARLSMSNVGQVDAGRTTRRSSRLSAVSSVGSSSPEPLSPQKARLRKSTRASVGGAGPASAAAATSGRVMKTRRKKA